MKPPFSIEYEEITPALATEWLTTKNIGNRALKGATVTAFSRDMIAGEWIPNHQGIAFGDTGNLIDGQHRLAAIVKSGVTLWLIVCRGVPEKPPGRRLSAIGSIDRGAARSIGDVLKLQHGFTKHQSFAASLVTSVVILSLRDVNRVRKCSISQTLAVLELFPDDAKWIIESRPALKIFNGSAILAPFAWARPIAPLVVERMLEKFVKGTGLSDGDPMLGLRNYVLASTGKNRAAGDHREQRLRLMEVVLHCLWHGIHEKSLRGETHGSDAKGKGNVTWFREQRKDFTNKIEAIFPVINEAKILPPPKPKPEKPKPAPKAVKPEYIPTERRGEVKMSDGRSRKEVLREIADRTR